MALSLAVPLTNLDRKREYWLNDFQLMAKQRVYFDRDSIDAGRGTLKQVIHLLPNDIVTSVWVNVIEAAPENATIDLGYGTVPNYWGNGLLIDSVGFANPISSVTDVWNFDQIPRKGSDVTEIVVPGLVLGDSIKVIPSIYLQELHITASILYDERVEVQIANLTNENIVNPGKATFTVLVNKAPFAMQPLPFASKDTIDIKATTDLGDVDINSGVIDVLAMITRV